MTSWVAMGALHYRPQNGKCLLCRNLDRESNMVLRAHTLGRSPLRQAPYAHTCLCMSCLMTSFTFCTCILFCILYLDYINLILHIFCMYLFCFCAGILCTFCMQYIHTFYFVTCSCLFVCFTVGLLVQFLPYHR